MSFENYSNALDYINQKEEYSFEDSFSLAKFCSEQLLTPGKESEGREILIRIFDKFKKVNTATSAIWYDLLDVAGLYPYLSDFEILGSSQLRHEFHKSRHIPNVFLHEEQLQISQKLLSKESVIISAPTSFGKSILIEEIVASKIYKNIVIIQPTLALLDETRKKLRKYSETYDSIVSTSQKPIENRSNLFLFTAERVVEYKDFPDIDFFVIDEFYKLSLLRDDERSIALNHAFYKLLKLTKKFYLLGPVVRSIPKKVHESLSFNWIHTNYSTVAVNEIDIKEAYRKNDKEKRVILYELLLDQEESTLIYCSSPQRATSLASEFLEVIKEKKSQQLKTDGNNPMISWVKENMHTSWSLSHLLEYSIAFHHGALPRHLGSSIVDGFNEENIKYLFCTSTLIEGVNTVAKNIVLFDRKKGPKPIDYFDYRNIAGRSGRMKVHYTGNVYKFNPEPDQYELDLDIPIITLEDAPEELLIQVDQEEMDEKSRDKLKDYSSLPEELKSIIKENSGIVVEGQLNLLTEIDGNVDYYHELLSWRSLPSYKQLNSVCELIWEYLKTLPGSDASIKSPAQLAKVSLDYLRIKSISGLIKKQLEQSYWKNKIPDEQERIDKIVYDVLNYSRTWFDFKLPKYLMVIDKLQRYVFPQYDLEPGDYGFFASELESSFLPKYLSMLLDYDVPSSAVRKLVKYIKERDAEANIINALNALDFEKTDLNEYEKQKLQALLIR
ncbi:DEAD/DEAH box helicase [Leptospira haakeii]|uniref:Helicase n=1 Tax=Leptospira haakeii TaxID=2023198 RepID=A0ABX4PK47_9LEPT|nr:DEAD/DEAH box helicase [Leptospira haakeii]PKA16146.1 hypothetical protein CH363_08340 [Leptospira haakeii]PKA18445.1 hypothetical protein CH377_17225 [Leptospira haakeii]